MLSRARYIDEPKMVVYEKSICTLKYGQFIFGRKKWSEVTGVSEQRLRGLIKKLITDNMLVVSSQTNHFTIYEIVNYAKFNQQDNQLEPKEQQGIEGFSNQQTDQQLTSSQPTTNQQLTTNEECIKKDKKDKEDICIVFSHWNSKKIIVHKTLTDKLSGHINARFDEGYLVNEIIEAINNYDIILKDDEKYFWSYKWGLGDFLLKGLDKFKTESEPFKNYANKSQKPKEVKTNGHAKSTEFSSQNGKDFEESEEWPISNSSTRRM